ncbi:MAG: hypothetical protein D6826_05965, partial [Alphaproteobacteria bacterium]
MVIRPQDVEGLRETFGRHRAPILSVYADINPAKTENAGKAWLKRVKNALRDMPDLHVRRKHRRTLYDEVLYLLEELRPNARTLALFAAEDEHGNVSVERLDLQVELPVVDLAQGRVEARWGEPYLTPLLFAVDEYERAGVVHLEVGKWRFHEIFLGEIEEDTAVFAEITAAEWSELGALEEKLKEGLSALREHGGGKFARLSPRERKSAKVHAWMHKFYVRLAHLLEKAVVRLGVSRLVLMGEDWQTSRFAGYLSRNLRQRLKGRVAQPRNAAHPSPKEILDKVQP